MAAEDPESTAREERIAALVGACSDRLNAGDTVDLDRIAAAHPDLAPELAQALAVLHELTPRPAPPEKPPETLGDYHLAGQLGRGGMGLVYEARHLATGERLALKILPGALRADPDALARFRREALLPSLLEHPGIAAVRDAGIAGGIPYIAMRFVEGETLGKRLRFRAGRSPPDRDEILELVRIIEGAARALHAAHEAGLVHRDIKPENIMVTPAGEPVILDFGLARAEEAGLTTLTGPGSVLGTPAYMSPEQLGVPGKGEGARVDRRTDVYALGVTLYECLTSRLPFEAPTREALYRRILTESPVRAGRLNPRIDRDLEVIIDTALQKEPDARYRTALDLAEDLRRLRARETIRARRPGPLRRLRRWAGRNPALAASTLGLIGVLAAGLAVALGLLSRVSGEKRQKEIALQVVEEQKEDLARLLAENREALRRQEGLRLAAQSAAVLPENPGLALLLALEGARRHEDLIARNALAEALAALRESRTLLGHAGGVNAASFSPDGRLVVTAAGDASVRIWNASDGALLRLLEGHTSPVNRALFSTDGTRIISASNDGEVRIWRLADSALELSFRERGAVLDAAFVPGGAAILTATSEGVQLRDQDGETLAGFPESGLRSVALSPDGSAILTASASGVRWRRLPDGAVLAVLAPAEEQPRAAGFDPRGERALVTSGESRVVVRDLRAGRELLAFEVPEARRAVFDPSGRWIATSGRDRTVRIWSARDGAALLALEGHEAPVTAAAFDAEGERLVTASLDGTARIWTLGGGRGVADLEEPHGLAAVAAAAPGSGGAVKGAGLTAPEDGAELAILVSRRGRVRWWDPAAGRVLEECALEGLDELLHGADIDPCRRRIAGVSGSRTLRLWDARTGLSTGRVELTGERCHQIVLAPDGRRAFVHLTGAPAIMDLESGEILARLSSSGNFAVFAAFDPDGSHLVYGPAGGMPVVAETATGTTTVELGSARTKALAAAFSPGGTRILTASADHTGALWDARTGTRTLVLRGHEAAARAAAFGPDGRLAATGAMDRTLRLWDTASGAEVMALRGHPATLTRVFFTARGSYAIACGENGTARAWPLAVRDTAERRRPRDLTPAEMDRYEIGGAAERAAYRRRWQAAALERELDASLERVAQEPLDRAAYWAVVARLRRLTAASRARDGEAAREPALEYAVAAVERTGRRDADLLGVLAEVHEDAGRLRDAILGLEEALRLPDATAALAARLEGLRAAALPDLPTYGSIDTAIAAEVVPARLDGLLPPHAAYLEGRLLARAGRYREAVVRLEAAAGADPGAPEPLLALAEVLRALGERRAAERRLGELLASGAHGRRDLWERWFEIRAVDLAEEPAVILAALPRAAGERTGPGADLAWLLAELTAQGAVRINAGGGEYRSGAGSPRGPDDLAHDRSAAGPVWGGDRFYLSGFRFFGDKAGGAGAPLGGEIAGTADDPLYRTERWFVGDAVHPAGYRIPLPPGRYRVRLGFAEIFFSGPGERVFDVSLEGETVLEGYDPAAAGPRTAGVRSFEVEVEDGFLEILFTARRNAPKVSAIEVARLGSREG